MEKLDQQIRNSLTKSQNKRKWKHKLTSEEEKREERASKLKISVRRTIAVCVAIVIQVNERALVCVRDASISFEFQRTLLTASFQFFFPFFFFSLFN